MGPPFLQELLLGGTRIIFALGPEDEKFFLKGNLSFFSSPTLSRESELAMSSQCSFHISDF